MVYEVCRTISSIKLEGYIVKNDVTGIDVGEGCLPGVYLVPCYLGPCFALGGKLEDGLVFRWTSKRSLIFFYAQST